MFHVKHKIRKQDVSRETYQRICKLRDLHNQEFEMYADRLQWWNSRHNLLSRGVSRGEILKHIYHSLWITASAGWQKSSHGVIVDAGSGGGLPGIPLAIVSPMLHTTLSDVVEKKVLVTETIIKDLGLQQRVRAKQVDIKRINIDANFDYVSKHAFKLSDFLNFTRHQNWTRAYFLKGENFRDEVKEVTETDLVIDFIPIFEFEPDPFFAGKYLLEITRE